MVTRSESRSIFLYRNFTFSVIIIQLSSAVLFGKSGFHVTAYFREAEGIEPGNPIHYAGVDVGMVDHISIENGEAVLVLRFYDDVKVPRMRIFLSKPAV